MPHRWMLLIVAVAIVVTSRVEASALASVEVQLYPLSGEVRLANPNATPFDFVFYELTSSGGTLTGVPGSWTSISDNYDASGSGAVDSVNQWAKFSATASDVAEGLLVGSGSQLSPYSSISLGQIWNPEAVKPNDITVTILDGNSQVAEASLVISIVGDYNRDLVVDALDYVEWSAALNSTTSPNADGNFDGIVDAADYSIWRDNFGVSLVGAGYGALVQSVGGGSAAVGVPEPAAVVLMVLAGSSGFVCFRRRRRVQFRRD
ncbi:MAG: dockerin type I domain-containing protein [Pirellulales bacterium]